MHVTVIVIGGTTADVPTEIAYGKTLCRSLSITGHNISSTTFNGSFIIAQRIDDNTGRLKIIPAGTFDWIYVGGDPNTGYLTMDSLVYGIITQSKKVELLTTFDHVQPPFAGFNTARLPFSRITALPSNKVYTESIYYKTESFVTDTSSFAPIVEDNPGDLKREGYVLEGRKLDPRFITSDLSDFAYGIDPVYLGNGPVIATAGNYNNYNAEVVIDNIGVDTTGVRFLFNPKHVYDAGTVNALYRGIIGIVAENSLGAAFPTLPIPFTRAFAGLQIAVLDDNTWVILGAEWDIGELPEQSNQSVSQTIVILRTTDAGGTWNSLPVPADFNAGVGSGGISFFTGVANQAVNALRLSVMGADKLVVSIFDQRNAVNASDGKSFVSTDVGDTWVQQPATFTYIGAHQKEFVGEFHNVGTDQILFTMFGGEFAFDPGVLTPDFRTYIYYTNNSFASINQTGEHPIGNVDDAKYRLIFPIPNAGNTFGMDIYTMINNRGFTPYATPSMQVSKDLGLNWTKVVDLPQLRFARLLPLAPDEQGIDKFFPNRFI